MKFKIFLAVAAFAISALASAQTMSDASKQDVLTEIGKIISTRAYVGGVDFSKWDEFSTKHKPDFMKAATQDSFAGAVNRALDEFGFSHIQLLTPRSAQTRVTGTSVGIGVLIQPDPKGIRIVKVLKGGPAESAGVQVGDIIIKADGEKVDGPEKVRGPKGTKVKITVLRADKEIDIPIVRNEFSLLEKDELEWIDSKTALLTINTFSTGYERKLIDGYFDQINAKAERLIIDLHTNGGGAVTNLTHLAGKVMNVKNSMGAFVTRYQADKYKEEHPGAKDDPVLVAKEGGIVIHPIARREAKPFAGELVVFIGPGSASASEIFAAAVDDNKRGKVIGAKSAGAVLASTFMSLPEGWSLQIPMMEYVTAGGKRLEGSGVAPSIKIEATKLEERAEVIKAATEAFLAIKRDGIGLSETSGGN